MKRDEIPGMILKIRQLWNPRRGVVVKLKDAKKNELYRICCGESSNPTYLVAERCRIWDANGNQLYQGELGDAMMKGISLRRIAELEYWTCSRTEPLKTDKC